MDARNIKQADIARELGISEMTVHRLLKALHRNGQPLSELDLITALAVGELKCIGLSTSVALELLIESESEMRYLEQDPRNRCFVVFVETAERAFRVRCLTHTHLESTLNAFPLALVMPLHEIVARASERLALLKAKKEASA